MLKNNYPLKTKRGFSFLLLIIMILNSIMVLPLTYAADAQDIISTSFEEDTGGFYGRPGNSGTAVATISTSSDMARTGSKALKVTNRTKSWGGPTINLTDTLEYSKRYDISVWVQLPSGAGNKTMGVSLEIKMADGRVTYPWVGGDTKTVSAGGWVEFRGEYVHTYVGELSYIGLNVQSTEVGSFTDFYIDDFSLVMLPDIQLTAMPSLKEEYADDFYIGNIYDNRCLTGADKQLVTEQFNVLTAGNLMKPENLLQGQDADGNLLFNWADADAFVDFCEDNDIEIVGHTLIWGEQTPEWMTEGTADEVKARMKQYIEAVMGRYKGRIKWWDVVNEALNPTTNGYRSNIWSKSELGTEYVYWAYKYATDWALANDPDVQLLYNDFNETQSSKLQGMYDLVYDLKINKGLKIDGVGLQAHYYLDNYADRVINVETAIDKLSSIPGIKIHISELDVCMGDGYTFSDQAQRYADLFRLFERKKNVIERVSLWGYDDGSSWRSAYYPTLLNADYTPKEAFWACADYERYEFNKDYALNSRFLKHTAPKGSATVDAALDHIYRHSKEIVTENGKRAKVIWDEDYLYIISDCDNVAVYINEDGKGTGGLKKGDAHYIVNAEGAITFGGDCDKHNFILAQKDGITEMAIPFRLTQREGNRIGFDIALDGQLWNGLGSDSKSNTANYGTLTLEYAVENSTAYHKQEEIAAKNKYTVSRNIRTDDFSGGIPADYKKYNDALDTSALTASSATVSDGRLRMTGEGLQIRLDTSYEVGTKIAVSADVRAESAGEITAFVKIMRGTSNLKYAYMDTVSLEHNQTGHISGAVQIPTPGFTPKDTYLIIDSTCPVWELDNLKVDIITDDSYDVVLWEDPLTANTVTVTDSPYLKITENGAGSITYNGGWKSMVYSANSNDHELDRGFKVSLPVNNLKYGDIATIYADIRDNYANATEKFYFILENDGEIVQNILLKSCDLPEKYSTATRNYFKVPVLVKDFDKAYFMCKFSIGSGGSVIMRDFRFHKTAAPASEYTNKSVAAADKTEAQPCEAAVLDHDFARIDGWYLARDYSGAVYSKTDKAIAVAEKATLDISSLIEEGHTYSMTTGTIEEKDGKTYLILPAGTYSRIRISEFAELADHTSLILAEGREKLPDSVQINGKDVGVIWQGTELDKKTVYGITEGISQSCYVCTAQLTEPKKIKITDYTFAEDSVELQLESNFTTTDDIFVIVAVYVNEDTLYSLDIRSKGLTANTPGDVTLALSKPDGSYTIRAYLWDNELTQYSEGMTLND